MFQKSPKIVSKKLRQSANGKHCTLRVSPGCNGSVVLCHLNSAFKGIGNKSPDLFGVFACHPCHALLDASKVSYKDQLRALQETQMQWVADGLIIVS